MNHIASILLALVVPCSVSFGDGELDDKARNVAILVYEGVELLDFAGPGEVFATSGRGAFRVYTVAGRLYASGSKRPLAVVVRSSNAEWRIEVPEPSPDEP